MNRINNEEIKKSLLLCSDLDLSCKDCMYHSNYVRCNEALSADARELIIEQENEIAQLKAENVRLTTKLGQVLLSIDTVKEMNTMCSIDEQRKRAIKEFVDELRNKCSEVKGYYYSFGNISGVIEELLEEYDNAKDKS